ncbi:MAG TPA: hypothetical protein VJG49_01850 [Candidatus Nanoarchaeia archaeon]|nr:hypothetical protein [Candidatus Nanoarchaeia archaeon]
MVQFNTISIDEEAHEEEEPPSIDGYISREITRLEVTEEDEIGLTRLLRPESEVEEPQISLDYTSCWPLFEGTAYLIPEQSSDSDDEWETAEEKSPSLSTSLSPDLTAYSLVTYFFDTSWAGFYYLCPVTPANEDVDDIALKWYMIMVTMNTVQRELREMRGRNYTSCNN